MSNQIQPCGMVDFIRFVNQGHREWSFLAVKAPIAEVAQTFADFRCAKRWKQSAEKRASEEEDYTEVAIPVIEVLNREWTVILREMYGLQWIDALHEDAQFLSEQLQTRAITCLEEDTSCALGYELYEDGKQVEWIQWAPGLGLRFKSSFRKKPELEFSDEASEENDLDEEDFDDEDSEIDENDDSSDPVNEFGHYINKILCDFGVYIPACHVISVDENLTLAIGTASTDLVGRVDIIDLENH